MRRTKARRKYRSHKLLFIFILLSSLISVGYGRYLSKLTIGGTVKGEIISGDFVIDPDSNPNLDIQITSINNWLENGIYNYEYSYVITNIGKNAINSFTLTTTFSNELYGVQTQQYSSSFENKTLTIVNPYQLKKKKSVTISFIVTSPSPYLRITNIKLSDQIQTQITDIALFPVEFNIINNWGKYTYQYDVKVTNKTANNITYWQLDVALPSGTSFDNGWNAIFSTSGNILTIKNESYNGNITINNSATFGLQLTTDISNFIPSANDINIIIR